MKRIGYALIHLPHTAELKFPGGRPPLEPTPDVLVNMLEQLREILVEKTIRSQSGPALNGQAPAEYQEPPAKTMTATERRVWAAWNMLSNEEPSPVKKIAKFLGMEPADVAFIVYPAEQFGAWDDSQEPDL